MAKSKTKDEAGADVTPWDDISIGDQVKHPLWGAGTVLYRSGSGETAKGIVVFAEEGQKKLMLKYANLKKIGSAPKAEQAKLKAAAEKPIVVEEEEGEALLPAAGEMEDIGDAADIFPDEEAEFGAGEANFPE